MSRDRDIATPDMFGAFSPAQPGSLAMSVEIAHTMSEALKAAYLTRQIDREQVAARMTQLIGSKVSVAMLNAYTSEARETHNVSLERAIAFDHATESYALLELHARKCNARALRGNDVLLAELGRIAEEKRELAERERALRTLARVSR